MKTRWVVCIHRAFIDSYHRNLKENVPAIFNDREMTMKHLKKVFKTTEHVFFNGTYDIPVDPLISDKEHVKMTAHDVWKVTGY